jgi:hypothetical protein
MGSGIGPERPAAIGSLRKNQRVDPMSCAALCLAQDQKGIGMSTHTEPDSRPRYVGCSLTFGWSESMVKLNERGDRVMLRLNFHVNLLNVCKNIIY